SWSPSHRTKPSRGAWRSRAVEQPEHPLHRAAVRARALPAQPLRGGESGGSSETPPKFRLGLSVPNRGVVIGAGDPHDLLPLSEVADRSELLDAVFTGDSLVAKPRIAAIVF